MRLGAWASVGLLHGTVQPGLFGRYSARMTNRGSVLIVCTGNVCRSPYIEHVLALDVAEFGIEVRSAGTVALVGEPMQDGSSQLLTQIGCSPEQFRARQMTADLAAGADLILTVTREHRTDVVRAAPQSLRYTFALSDFSDLVQDADLSESAATEQPEDNAVTRLVARALARRTAVAPRPVGDSGIVDPYGQGAAVFARMRDETATMLPDIARAITQVATVANRTG